MRNLKKGLVNFEAFFWPSLLVGEVIVYLIVRKRMYKKIWVIFHSWSCIIAFFIWPIVSIFISQWWYRHYPPKEYRDMLNRFVLARLMFFYLLIAIGHLFFILTIVKSFNKQITVVDETPGVLDEFVS